MSRLFSTGRRVLNSEKAAPSPKQSKDIWRKPAPRVDHLVSLKHAVGQPAENTILPRFWPTKLSRPTSTTYEPSDFGFGSIRASRAQHFARQAPKADPFVKHNIDPIDLWTSPDLLSQYITANGKILPSHELGLKGTSQRKLAKAIRRARAAGLLSTVHRDVSQLSRFSASHNR